MEGDEDIVLPCAPSDEEKLQYIHLNRLLYFPFGIFSIICINVGMILFIKSSYYFFFLLPFVIYQFIYLSTSYVIGIFGGSFDYEQHKRNLAIPELEKFCPSVDIFLPCCGEPLVVLRNTYKYVKRVDYCNYMVHVLDDKDKPEVKELAAEYGFNYIVRPNRPHLKKAGNLRYAFTKTNGDFFLILDADFCPRHDFLKETLPYFYNYPNIAILQTPQYFRVRDEQTWVEKGAGAVQELFYRLIQTYRNNFNASICVGTSAVYRRVALAPFGGTYEIEHSEDVHTGFNATINGWLVKYLPLNLSMGCCPDNLKSFFTQQYRWASGSTSLLTSKMFWKSNLTKTQKICYLCGMFYYSASAISIFTTPLSSILIIYFLPDKCLYYNSAFTLPSFIYSLVFMRIWQKQRYRSYVPKIRIFTYYANLIAIADTILNTRMEWKVSGSNAKKQKNKKYKIAVTILIVWTAIYQSLTIGGIIWRSFEFAFYNFLPSLLITLYSLFLTIEIFTGENYRRNLPKKLAKFLKERVLLFIIFLSNLIAKEQKPKYITNV